MKEVIKCTNNIHTDMYDFVDGHYHPAGNFQSIDSLIDLDVLYAHIIHRMVSLYEDKEAMIKKEEYSYVKILNCFRNDMAIIEKDEKMPAFIETLETFEEKLESFDGKLKEQIYETFFKMESKIKEYELKQLDAEKLNRARRLAKEQRYKETEAENKRLKEEISRLNNLLVEKAKV